jgi:hypothetical protein
MIKTLERMGAASKLRITPEKMILATRANQVRSSGVIDLPRGESLAADPFSHGAEEIVRQFKAGASALKAV